MYKGKLEAPGFAKRVATAMEDLARDRNARALVVVAPARTLADVREALHPDIKKRIIAEIGKDLTKYPIYEIEKHLHHFVD